MSLKKINRPRRPSYIFGPIAHSLPPYQIIPSLLTKEECALVIEMSLSCAPEPGRIGVHGQTDDQKRKANVYKISYDPNRHWLFEALADKVTEINAKFWNFNLVGFTEPLQVSEYRAEDQGFYDWHRDQFERSYFAFRKLTALIVLSSNFTGGEFEFFDGGLCAQLVPGSMLLFPSYVVHRVTPTLSGVRWSLVAWSSGPPFR